MLPQSWVNEEAGRVWGGQRAPASGPRGAGRGRGPQRWVRVLGRRQGPQGWGRSAHKRRNSGPGARSHIKRGHSPHAHPLGDRAGPRVTGSAPPWALAGRSPAAALPVPTRRRRAASGPSLCVARGAQAPAGPGCPAAAARRPARAARGGASRPPQSPRQRISTAQPRLPWLPARKGMRDPLDRRGWLTALGVLLWRRLRRF